MKCRVGILPLAVIVVILFSTLLSAEEYTMPLTKVIGPGHTSVKFDTRIYNFYSEVKMHLMFEKVDERHVKLFIRPIKGEEVQPYCEVSVQWDLFPPALLTLSSEGNDFLLDMETGYAEK